MTQPKEIYLNNPSNPNFKGGDFKYLSEEHFNSLIEEKDKEILRLKEVNECHKECFEKFMPTEYWDEATEFISAYGSGLAKDLLNKER